MNGLGEFYIPAKPPISPRPPVVGEEVKVFHDTSGQFIEHNRSSKKMEEESQTTCEGDKPDSLSNNETGSETTKNVVASLPPYPSPPAPYKWAQSLQCLLDDAKGVALFEQFLKQEGHDTRSLSFWFACRGVKKTDPSDKEKLHRLINVLYDKKVKRINAISLVTKNEIKQKLASNTGVDINIFDNAQREVEAYMLKTTYPNFLTSDIYLHYLESVQNENTVDRECHGTPVTSDLLPTVHEDHELSAYQIRHLGDEAISRRRMSYKIKSESQAPTYLKSPYGNYSSYHTKYASYLPGSAQDSELQSLSSDAQTDDTMSQTDSVVDFPMHNRCKQKRHLKPKYCGVLNKDRLNLNNFIPRTQREVPESIATMATKNPAAFHAVLVEKLKVVEEDQKTREKFNERYQAIEGPPLQPLIPAEDNDQDILDQHVSRVFKDTGLTPTLSPDCASPPVAKSFGEDPNRFIRRGPNATPEALAGHCRKFEPYHVPFVALGRRDHDTHSNDSGALTDYWNSEDNLQSINKLVDYSSSSEGLDHPHVRRTKETLKRYFSKKNQNDSASSCVDSGISVACEPLSSQSSLNTRGTSCLDASEFELELQWKNNSTSPVLSRSSSSRKAAMYNSLRTGTLDAGTTHLPLVPSQPVAQDPSMPALPPPDTITNLLEARRRLEDESRTKMGKSKYCIARHNHEITKTRNSFRACGSDDGSSHRKQSKKSATVSAVDNATSSTGVNDTTIVGYTYDRDAVPYKSRLPGKNITLRQFKSHLNKKGNYRYFFKRVSDDFGTGVVFEEVTDDYEILPLWEGKVFCAIETLDESNTNEDKIDV
ncbi:axin-1 [Nephila pilipes]|uniref:Axin-1 n=1 Tax=Nephila pilipes TaxID=299642 RepID=A0A8X6TUW7_NEPPI|nr:axin-1 [Nephila pilipes]